MNHTHHDFADADAAAADASAECADDVGGEMSQLNLSGTVTATVVEQHQ